MSQKKVTMYCKIKFYWVFFLIFLFSSCSQEAERQALIQATIQAKVQEFRERKQEEYRTKLFDAAVKQADSILLLNADLWQIPMDSLRARPPRVSKPNTPKTTISVDSTPVKPLFPIKK